MEREDKGLILQISEDGVATIKEEPYAVIECPTEEDYERLVDAVEKSVGTKPLELGQGKYGCASCKDTFEYLTVEKKYNHCPNCGQKLDWTK